MLRKREKKDKSKRVIWSDIFDYSWSSSGFNLQTLWCVYNMFRIGIGWVRDDWLHNFPHLAGQTLCGFVSENLSVGKYKNIAVSCMDNKRRSLNSAATNHCEAPESTIRQTCSFRKIYVLAKRLNSLTWNGRLSRPETQRDPNKSGDLSWLSIKVRDVKQKIAVPHESFTAVRSAVFKCTAWRFVQVSLR